MKYFPESSPRAAVKALLRWIDNCSDLIKALDELKSLTGIRSTWLRNKWEPSWSISETHNPILLSTECSIQFLTECSIQFLTDCPIQYATECPVQLTSECPVQLGSDCSIIPQYDGKTQEDPTCTIAIFICCTFAVWKLKIEGWRLKHLQGQRLKTGPYTTEALPVLSISNHVLPLGGVGGGLIYHA